jgi:hypothetical protein
MRSLLPRIFPVFSPLERFLVSEVENRLEPTAQDLFTRQIRTVNLVQRHAKSREMCCYSMKWGRVQLRKELRFRKTSQELKLASVIFRVPDAEGRTWKAEFELVRGHFFSIVFDKSPEPIKRTDQIDVIDVKILADPMEESRDVTPLPLTEVPEFSGWIRDWLEGYVAQEAFERLAKGDRQLLLESIPAKLPADYLELTEQADGLRVEDCSILGLAQAYEIVLDDMSYYVLADVVDKGVLAVPSTGEDESVFYLDYRNKGERQRFDSFQAAVTSCIEEGKRSNGAQR